MNMSALKNADEKEIAFSVKKGIRWLNPVIKGI